MMIQMMTIVYQTSMEHHVFARLAWNIMFVEGGTSCMLLWNHPPAGRQAVHEMKQEKHQRSKCLLHLEDDFSISEVVSLCGSTSPIVTEVQESEIDVQQGSLTMACGCAMILQGWVSPDALEI